jgi:hypothetical protein
MGCKHRKGTGEERELELNAVSLRANQMMARRIAIDPARSAVIS